MTTNLLRYSQARKAGTLVTTPIKAMGLSRTTNVETAATVREDVDADFAKYCRVAETEEFLPKLFPVLDDIIDKVLAKVTGTYYDDNVERWIDFPSGKPAVNAAADSASQRPKEKALYAPFIKVANAIRAATEAVQAEENNDLRDVAEWVDYHSQAPQSSDLDAAHIRPDCLLAHHVSKFRAIASANETKQTENKAKEAQRQATLQASVWWLQIICAVEMKRKDSQNGLDIVKQLIGYLRRILREQLDRRFVFGLTLGPNSMTVWLHDRSGVLGTTKAFNIHKEPRSFIRVIAAFSVLSMEELGYDTQMKFYASPTSIVPTYRLDDEAAPVYLSATAGEQQWVITTNDNEQYLTVKVLSMARAYMMQGRASLVWAVVPFKDGKVTSKKLLVLKQSWRPFGTESENEMLTKVKNAAAAAEKANAAADTKGINMDEGKDCIGQVQLEETISMRGKADTTGTLIRKGLEVRVSTNSSSSTSSRRIRDENVESYLHVDVTDDDIISIVPHGHFSSPPVSRVHTRLLLSTFGWPLKYFRTRREAVRGIRDAVGGHGYVYYNGLLHRDISPGNIVLAWCDEDVGTTGLGTKGCLIDFDRGKYGIENESALEVPATFDAVTNDDDLAPLFSRFFQKDTSTQITIASDAIIAGSRVTPLGNVYTYLSTVWTHVSTFAQCGQTINCSVLKWTKGLRKFSFKFTEEQRQSGSRTGTPPYTSGEILLQIRYSTKAPIFHDAIHDIESFFWVLVHICLTRSGPGQRRKELDGDSGDHKVLQFIIYCFFDAKPVDLGANKKLLFDRPEDFEGTIIQNFHPYFDELKPFMREWFSLLVLAYQYIEGYEYHDIHRRVLDILDRALALMPLEKSDSDEGREAVFEERRDSLYALTKNLEKHVAAGPAPWKGEAIQSVNRWPLAITTLTLTVALALALGAR
ncbi:hypothetical protein CPB85DRAFT_1441387 [Mucidula mucida]|nr:hypothetical protein CPB85DRAFT_1441387 [Mucidula mucida]